MSFKEQQEYYDSLQNKYKRERELLENYKSICNFDITELEKGPSESFLNSRDLQPGPEGEPAVPSTLGAVESTCHDALNPQPMLDSLNPAIKEENNSLMETDNSQAV